MGCCFFRPGHVQPRPAVPVGKVRMCIAGFPLSHNVGLTREVADEIARSHPDKYSTWFYFGGGEAFRGFINDTVKPQLNPEQQERFRAHKSAPFCWLEMPDGTLDAKGGGDRFREWAAEEFVMEDNIVSLCKMKPSLCKHLCFDNKTPGTDQREPLGS
eukprot:Hpha_TRINITY_DN2369_c0_g1::TRINITY_DN2369_c0_g1_i1::g.350::m.350